MFDRIGKHFYFFILIFIIGYVTASGQHILTLNECIDVALKQNLSIKSIEAGIQSTRLTRREIERSGLPQVKVGGSATYAPYSSQLGYDPALSNGGQVSAQVLVQEFLFDGGARNLRANQFDIDVERSRTEQRRLERDIRYIVAIAFFNVLQTQGEMALHQRRVEELSDYLELVNRLYHGGGVNYTDVLKTEVTYQNARITLQKGIQAYVTAKISLAEAMGTPRDTAFTVNGSLEIPTSMVLDSIRKPLVIDSLHSLDLQIAHFDFQRSLLDVQLVHAERLPTISLTGDIGLLTSIDNLQLPAQERSSMVGYSVGVSIENLLFNWGATEIRVQRQQIEAERIRLNYEQQQRALIAENERLQNEIASTIDQFTSINRTLKAAEDNFVLTKAQYAGGGTLALEVLSAEQSLADTRFAELQTRTDLLKLFAKVEQLRTY